MSTHDIVEKHCVNAGQALAGAGVAQLEEAVLRLDRLQTLNAFGVLSGARTPAVALV
jgi:hypothetical protein